ncbi:response regulator [Brevibacterium otitidis]|uniref:Response regulator n=1 Tax=Brevibacterium otitidis TaxID=53364 RepID=A0ABV5WYM2_9MICO|nr:response regulator [Brevibacterium otitidis]
MTTVFVVEDDATVARALMLNLTARDYTCRHASTGAMALRLAADIAPDVVLLDLGLPDLDGVDVIDGIRGWSQVPIIVVSARHEAQSKIEALDRGADDYVTKPFALGELLARLRAALRRTDPADKPPAVIESADGRIRVDLAATTVKCNGELVRLTPNEWGVLSVLARNHDRLVTGQELLHEVWGPQYSTETNYLRVYISHLRQKLEIDSAHPQYLITELGMGYRFVTTELG